MTLCPHDKETRRGQKSQTSSLAQKGHRKEDVVTGKLCLYFYTCSSVRVMASSCGCHVAPATMPPNSARLSLSSDEWG